MKSLLMALPLLFIWHNLSAQSADTSQIMVRRGPTIYYIDGVRVQANDSIKDSTSIQEIQIITGGLPINYGDVKGSLIKVTSTPPTEMDRKTIQKKQKMATE